jgi:hypothetical protein
VFFPGTIHIFIIFQRENPEKESNCFPYQFNDENIRRYPYIKKLSIPGQNTKDIPVSTDFIYQFVKNCSFSYQRSDVEKSYIANIIGPPRSHHGRDDRKVPCNYVSLLISFLGKKELNLPIYDQIY